MLLKIVVRERPNYKTTQIHEVYQTNVGDKVQEIIEEYALGAQSAEDIPSITITPL